MRLLLEETASLHPALLRLVGQLRENGGGAIIEGEGVEPDVVEAFAEDRHVHAVYVIETDPEMLRRTFAARASAARFLALSPQQQDSVVEMNRCYGVWLREQARRRNHACVPSRPWATLQSRVVCATRLR